MFDLTFSTTEANKHALSQDLDFEQEMKALTLSRVKNVQISKQLGSS